MSSTSNLASKCDSQPQKKRKKAESESDYEEESDLDSESDSEGSSQAEEDESDSDSEECTKFAQLIWKLRMHTRMVDSRKAAKITRFLESRTKDDLVMIASLALTIVAADLVCIDPEARKQKEKER